MIYVDLDCIPPSVALRSDNVQRLQPLALTSADPWLCAICRRRHANACPVLWGGVFVPAPPLPPDALAPPADPPTR